VIDYTESRQRYSLSNGKVRSVGAVQVAVGRRGKCGITPEGTFSRRDDSIEVQDELIIARLACIHARYSQRAVKRKKAGSWI
jgi:hypothetical protein